MLTPCGHIFCKPCLSDYFAKSKNSSEKPVNNTKAAQEHTDTDNEPGPRRIKQTCNTSQTLLNFLLKV